MSELNSGNRQMERSEHSAANDCKVKLNAVKVELSVYSGKDDIDSRYYF